MKNGGVLLCALLLVLLMPLKADAILTCAVKAACDPGDTEILKLTSLADAHVALPSQPVSYGHRVCCWGIQGITTSNTSQSAMYLRLSQNANANVAKISGDYPVAAFIGAQGPIECNYSTSCDPINQTCLVQLQSSVNTHVAQCPTSPNSKEKVCCGCKNTFEVNCADGIDDDCDGMTDCNDNNCDGSIAGNIYNAESAAVFDALVKVLSGTTTLSTTNSNSQGAYALTVKCGTFNIAVEHVDYATITRAGIVIAPRAQTILDFSGEFALAKGNTCEADCTFPGSNIIHASCNGKNGCAFFNSQAAQACDNAQPGWTREYEPGQNVVCPNGVPAAMANERSAINCTTGICVRSSAPVLYNGQQVKMVVVVASD